MRKLFRRISVFAATAAVGLTGFAAQASAAEQVYSGTGWKIETADGIHSLSPDPYVIQLVKPTSGDKLTDSQNKTAEAQLRTQLAKTAAQLTSVTGIKFTLSSSYHSVETDCTTAERHVIVVGLRYRPYDGKPGTSRTWPCYASGNHTAWGAWIWMDSEYWNPAVWTISSWGLDDLISHEVGHAVGLDHPNVDGSDANTTADPGECVTNSSKDIPVMCSPNGGYAHAGGSESRAEQYAGQYTPWDIAGLKALVANYTATTPQSSAVAPRSAGSQAPESAVISPRM
ncbi:hypothetical protein OG417_01635 [Actinoallomurus sp. NBC_01490]|uniref:hypothetical protein n=1 Tax=Actinoallomurus sp. NBC_01490 TaxID=2903557 RepID=UPI002E32593F|nr:hypothetical protein [Actinoallomurus sp. NBC_01490]